METGLSGKNVIVTGGNANVGRGIVLAFAREGAKIIVAARDEIAGLRVVERAKQEGAQDALWVRTDVLDTGQVEALMGQCMERFGSIDVLINNVGGGGIIPMKPFWETKMDEWKIDIDLTLMSTLNCTRAALPHMLEQKNGRIINIGSTAGFTGDVGMAVYSAAKGAIHTFTKILAREVGDYGITVNAVCPWGVAPEDLNEESSAGSRWNPQHGKFAKLSAASPNHGEDLKRQTLLGTALGRTVLKPSEVGAASVYLASDAASFITGQLLVVDGGMLLTHPKL